MAVAKSTDISVLHIMYIHETLWSRIICSLKYRENYLLRS